MLTAYKHMDVELRVMLPMSTERAVVNNFSQQVSMQKNNWFDLYRSYGVSHGQSKPDEKGGYLKPTFQPRTVSTYLFCQHPPLTIVMLWVTHFLILIAEVWPTETDAKVKAEDEGFRSVRSYQSQGVLLVLLSRLSSNILDG